MKIIGIEFRVGYRSTRLAEVVLVPMNIEVPVCCHGHVPAEFDLTVHTTLGDRGTNRLDLPRQDPSEAIFHLENPYQALQIIEGQISGMPLASIARKILERR